MSFVDQRRRRSSATVITVAGLHALAIYALVSGFGVKYIVEVATPFRIHDYPADPPPTPVPPQPDPAAKPDDRPIVAPRTPVDLGGEQTFTVPIDNIPVDLPPLPQPSFQPPPEPVPSIAPVSVRPANNPASWVSTGDYPSRDLREGNQGRVRFRLDIGTDGKVLGCTVTQPSGHQGLDQATCTLVSRRARFRPATDSSGVKVGGAYDGSVVWVIPE